MAYSTPQYDYTKSTNSATLNKGLQDISQNYGRFLSQERFRRGLGDANRQFKDQFPRVARNFNSRGIYDSGLRREAQQKNAQDYQRQTDRYRYDYAAEQNADQQAQGLRDAAYQNQLAALFEEFKRQQAAGFDPFANIKGMIY